MASGRKNYFRHSFFAHNDQKLRSLKDKIGIGFYFYWFTLLEVLGTESIDDTPDQYILHKSILRQTWGVSDKKTSTILCAMSAVGLLSVEIVDDTHLIELPNFRKYLGRYDSKIDKEKERKEKKRKEKESKETEPPPEDVVAVLDHLNEAAGRKFKPVQGNVKHIKARFAEGYKLEDFLNVVDMQIHYWGKDRKMKEYLRPQTLFNSEKFHGYVEKANAEIREQQS